MREQTIIKEFSESRNFEKLVEDTKGYTEFPLFVPSFRKGRLDKYKKDVILYNLRSLERKVYIFVYDFDFEVSGYDKMELPDNAEFVILSNHPEGCSYPNLEYKVYRMMDFAREKGISHFIKLDDDTKIIGGYVSGEMTESGKCWKRPQIHISNLLKIGEAFSKACGNFGMFSFRLSRTDLLSFDYSEIVKENFRSKGFYIFNTEVYNKSPESFHWLKMQGCHEDSFNCFTSYNLGFKCYRTDLFYLEELGSKVKSICQNDDKFKANRHMLLTVYRTAKKLPISIKYVSKLDSITFIVPNKKIVSDECNETEINERFITECLEATDYKGQIEVYLKYFPERVTDLVREKTSLLLSE